MWKKSMVAAIMAAAIGLSYCAGWRRATSVARIAAAAGGVAPAPSANANEAVRAASAARAAELGRAIAVGEAARTGAPAQTSAAARASAGAQANASAGANAGEEGGGVAVETVSGDTGSGKGSGVPSVFAERWADGKFAGFSADELSGMAERCELRWQLPRVPDARYVAAVRSLYVELTGDSGGAAAQDVATMADVLRRNSDEDAGAVQKRLAAARAGDAVTRSGGIYERFLQLQLDESERARADDVEGGAKFTLSGCDPGSAVFRSTR